MIRNTSKAANLANLESGNYATQRDKILNFIRNNPGCSRADIERGIDEMRINCVTGRVRELLIGQAVFEDGCKHDAITGRSVNCLFVRGSILA